MRILIDLTSLVDNFSGIERFALCVTKEMIKNTDNQFVLLFKNEIHPDFTVCGTNVTCFAIKGKNKLFFNQVLLPMELIKHKCDKYVFPAFPAPFLFFSQKSISAIHDLGCWDCPGCNKIYMEWYFKILYWKAALSRKKIITVSEFSKQRIHEILQVDNNNILVINNGIGQLFSEYKNDTKNSIRIKNKYAIPDNYLLCLSTLEPRKNLKLLIEAYSELLTEGVINYELVLAGRRGWMFDEVISKIDKEIAKHIYFTGFIDDDDLPCVYNMAGFFVFPSLYEGFGIPPVEAMSVGTNVISSDSSSLPEILGDAAIYFRNCDKDDLKAKIKAAVAMNEIDRAILREKGYEISKKYRWEYSAACLNSWI